jgi:TPR repeat protein
MEIVTMDARHQRTLQIGIFALCLASSVALADNAEEMARANDFYDKQQMPDASEIFKKLAKQNYLPAQARLGDLLDYSEMHEVATGWYIMAAFQGNPDGAYGLARMYFGGTGIKKDPEQALYWFKFAADKDNLNAVMVLERAYLKGASSGLPVPTDLKQAEYWKAKRIALDASHTKEFEEKLAAEKKKREEKAAAIRKADEEARKSKQGNAK